MTFDFEPASLKAMRKHIERINRMLNSPALAAINRQQDRLNKLLESPALRALKNHEERINTIYNSPALTAMREAEEGWSRQIGAQTLLVFKEHEERLEKIYNSPALAAMRAQEDKISRLFKSPASSALREYSDRLEKIYSGSVPDGLIELNEKWGRFFKENALEALNIARDLSNSGLSEALNIDDHSFEETIGLINEAYEETKDIEQAPLVSVEGYIQILLAILLFLAAYAASVESDKSLNNRIDNLETQISAQINNLNKGSTEGTFYIVQRTVNLRSENQTGKNSVVIDILYPNQRVRLLKRDGKWIYVTFFDYLAGVQRNGWVYKKYLKMEK